LGAACDRSFQNLLSSRLLSRNVNIEIYKIIIVPFVLYGCENLVSHPNGTTWIGSTEERGSDRRVVKIA
jgi:hypothetical protein